MDADAHLGSLPAASREYQAWRDAPLRQGRLVPVGEQGGGHRERWCSVTARLPADLVAKLVAGRPPSRREAHFALREEKTQRVRAAALG